MARKHFDTLMISGSIFLVRETGVTPTAHSCASFRLRRIRADRPHVLSLDLWVGFGNGDKHAGDSNPSDDPREAVPCDDPTRSGRAVRDGWQPVAVVNTDALTAEFVSRSVDDCRFLSHIAARMSGQGYALTGVGYAVTLFGATEEPTTLARNGVPRSAQFRNTDANSATHRAKAQRGGDALMEFGRNGGD